METKPAARAFCRPSLLILLNATLMMLYGCETTPPVRESTRVSNSSSGPLEIEWGGVPSAWNNSTANPR